VSLGSLFVGRSPTASCCIQAHTCIVQMEWLYHVPKTEIWA